MTESTDAEELEFQSRLGKVINKQPRLFQKWAELKEKFVILDLHDSLSKESTFTIYDAFEMIDKEFGDGHEFINA